MTGNQLRWERERLGISRAELAGAVGVSDEEVADWERRDAPVPAYARTQIASLLAAGRARILERSGLPDCAWAEARSAPGTRGSGDVGLDAAGMRAHVAACDLCQARERYVRERRVARPSAGAGGLRGGDSLVDLLAAAGGKSLALVAAGVAASLLGLARLLGHLPYSELVMLALYPFAFLLAAIVGVGLYAGVSLGLGPLRRSAVGRWIGRFAAGTGAMVAWVSPFLVSGYDRIGRKSRHVGWEDAIETALVVGLVFATLWPLVEALTDDP